MAKRKPIEDAVWAVYPNATHFGTDKRRGNEPSPSSEIYESDEWDAKVIGKGDSYEEAWADATARLPGKLKAKRKK